MKEKGNENNPRSRVHPQNASRDARGLFERPIVRQTRTRARCESQHTARDKRGETNTQREKRQTERTIGNARRTSAKREAQETRDMKENKEKGRKSRAT
jgi:hypothetical protein